MKRKLISVILCLSFVFGVFPFYTAFADDYTLIYKIENGSATITGISDPSYSGDIVIPKKLSGYTVTKIDSYAFYNCPNISSLTIPSTLIEIGENVFSSSVSFSAVYQGSLSDWCSKINIHYSI